METRLKRFLSLALALLMVFSMMPQITLGASAANTRTIYLNAGGSSLWDQAGAWFAAWVWGGSSADAWYTFESTEEAGIYKIEIPADSTGMKINRMASGATAPSWTQGDSGYWNQTGDLTISSNNLFTITNWSGGSWSVYTPEVVEPETTTPETTTPETEAPVVEKVTVYCVNSNKWETVSAYCWNDGGASAEWPGVAMTKTGDTVNGFDVYSVAVDKTYTSIIFNNSNNGFQTADLTLEAGEYYDAKSNTWYASLNEIPAVDPLATDASLPGSFNDWNATNSQFKLTAEGATTATVTLTLAANTTYEFKVVNNGLWLSTSTAITGDTSGLQFSSTVPENAMIATADAGEYVFTYDLSANTLAVAYPAAEPEEEITYTTIYFQNNWMWTDVCLYTWDSNDSPLNSEWPGTAMTFYENDGTYDVYTAEVPSNAAGIIVNGTKNDGTGTTDKTPNITSGWYEGICYYMTWDNGNAVGTADIDVILPEETEPEVTYVAYIGEQGYESLQAAINAASTEAETVITLVDGEISGDVNITIAAVGEQKAAIKIVAAENAKPVITGTVTLGLYQKGTTNVAKWNAPVTFEGITFDHAESAKHSIEVQSVSGLTLTECTIIGDGEYGINSAAGGNSDPSTISGCTFTNAGMQVTGNFGTGLQINNCTFNNSRINVQGGNGVTVKGSTFNATVTDANVGDSFYVIRSNDNPIVVENSKFNIDSTVTGVAADQTKWGVFWQRQAGGTKWTMSGIEVNFTEAAMAQTELLLNKNGTTTEANKAGRVTITGLTSTSNDTAALIARSEGYLVSGNKTYLDGVWQKPVPAGDDPIGYTSATTIWGQTWSNAIESYVIKVLDANGTVMGTTSLNTELDVPMDGDVEVTWHISLDPSADTDTYWIQEWTTAPSLTAVPTKVELWVDGVKVNEGPVQLNGPDNLNKIYAASVDANGNITKYYTKLADAMGSGTVLVLRDVSEDLADIKDVTLIGNNVTVTSTNTGWINMTNVNVGSGVTLAMDNAYYTGAGVNVIEGTLSVGTLYNANNSKTTVQNGGKIVTTGMIVNRYHTDAEAGIYVYGDGNAETVEVSCADTIGTYSGTFYAKDAVVEGNMLWIDYKKNSTEESDSYSQSTPKFENSVLNIASELRFYKDATLTLTNSSVTAGKVQIRQDATPVVNIDSTSSIKATTVENLSGANLNAVLGEDGTVTFKRVLLGTGTEEDPILINDLADLILFRDTVNTYTQDGSNQFKGKYVKLTADIDLAGINWTPIGDNTTNDHEAFLGIFDGGNHTISNLYINSDGDHLGFFARVGSYAEGITPTVKNLKFHNVDVSSNTLNGHGGSYVGGVIANAGGNSVVSNITVTGDVYVVGYGYVGGIVGHGYPDIDNCHVTANDGSWVHAHYWCAGGIIGYAGEGGTPIINCSVSGLDIWSAYGAAAAVAGLLQDGNKLENVSASNVEITSNSDYCMGYIAGNGESSTLTNVTMENVTATAKGKPITATDAAATIGDAIYFDLQSAIDAVAEGEIITLLREVNVTTPAYGQNALNISRAVNFTIDLNGKTLSADTGNSVVRFNIAGSDATSNVTVTIKNGTVVAGSNTWCALMASGISADVKAVMNLEDLTVTGGKAGDLLVKAWGNGLINAKNVTVNAYNCVGGFYAVGGEIVLDNCTVEQKGLHTAPYLSTAFAVSGGGKLTVNSGTYSSEPTAASEGNNQGSSHGCWVGNVMNSGGTLIINGGTFSNGNYGDDSLATNPRGLICIDAGAKLEINGGTFNALGAAVEVINNLGDASKNPTAEIYGGNFVVGGDTLFSGYPTGLLYVYGGTYSAPVAQEFCATGYVPTEISEGVYGVKAAVEAKIGKKSYATLAEAVEAAVEGDTILLQADVIVDEVLVIDHNITIADYGTYSITFIGEGAIHITGSNNLNLDKVILTAPVYADSNTAGATIGNKLAITGTSEHKSTVTSDGETFTVTNPAWIADVNGTVYYLTIDEAIKGAGAGDTVNIYAGEYTQNLSVNKGITVVGETDDEGNNLVSFKGQLSITADGAAAKNMNFNNGGSTAGKISAKDVLVEGCSVVGGNGFRYCYTSGTVTFKDSTITGSTYGIHFDGNAGGNIVIDNCVITGWTSFAGTIEKVTMKDTTFAEGNYNYVRFYQSADMENCTFNDKMKVDIAVSGATLNVTNPTFNGEIENLFNASDIDASNIYVDGTRLITPEASINGVEYDTFAEAIAAIGDGDVVIELITDVTLDYNAREAYGTDATTSVTINGNGKTVTLNQKDSDWSSIGLKNNAKLVLNNMTVEKTGYGDTSGAWNTHAIQFTCPVEMTDVVINNAIAVEAGATLNNVTINEDNGYYGLWIVGNGQTVTVNGGAINATNGGRGIKIADQYVDAPAQVTLNVEGTKFTTAKKAAVLVSSTAGAKITANGADITGVAEDTVNFVWVDEDWAGYYNNVKVYDEATKAQENVESFTIVVHKDSANGTVRAYFKNLDDLFAASATQVPGSNYIDLLGDVVAENKVNVNYGSNRVYTFGTSVEGGVTMTFKYADNWNYLPKFDLGENITMNVPYLQVIGGDIEISGTINTNYLYLYGTGEGVTITETGVVNANVAADKTVQVKGGTVLTVNGELNTSTLNVWTQDANNSELIVSGTNAKVTANHLHAWNGKDGVSAQKVVVENGATLTATNFQADRGSEVTVDNAKLSSDKITLGYDDNIGTLNVVYGGEIELTNNGTITVAKNGSVTMDETAKTNAVAIVTTADGVETYHTTLDAALEAVENGGTVKLLTSIELTAPLTIKKSITIDGNGKTITQSAECNNNIALLYFEGSENAVLDVAVKNLTFDGLEVGAAIRTLYANMTIDNCVFQNCEHTVGQGLVRLTYGTAQITNSKFLNNNCSMGISFNWDGAGLATDTLTIDNCEFTGNTANKTALVYYVKGAGCNITNSKFVNNKVNCNSNGATIYLGFQENCVVTGNLFEDNAVTEATSSTRVAGAIFFGYEADISNNAFINNTASNANGDVLGQVCTSTYYECEIDLSGNYWGGNAPVMGKDYTVQHQTGDASFALDNYYKTYTDGTLSDLTATGYVAKVGKFSYFTLEDAIAAVQNGGIIELLDDVEISKTLDVSYNDDSQKITITINGNGHTIKAVGEGWTNKMHMVDIAWNVTLNDVTFDGNNTSCRGVQFYTSSSTLNNVTVKNISADLWSWTDYAIHGNASDLTVTGTLTVENCTYGNLHMDIGKNLPEGTVSVVDTASATLKGAKIVLEGANTSATAKRLHVGYAAAELNGTYYGVLADAIALAQVDDQIVLMADAEKIELTKSINLDVNGKTVGEFVLTAADVTLTAEEGLNVTTAVEDHKVVYANGVYSVERKPNADITYGIYDVETTGEAGTDSYRERMAVDLYNVYAKESLVVELWSGETKLSTTTLRESDRDDATVKFYPYEGSTTANIVIAGRLAGSWDTEWHVAPSVYSLPDSIKVYADGELVATWNGGFMNEEEAENFGELTGVEKPFKLAGANVLLGDSLKMFFYVNYADLEGEDYYAEIRRTFADGTADEVIKVPYSEWEKYNSTMIRIGYSGLSAKAMTDELYVTIYNGEDVAVSQVWEDSIKAYAMRQLSTTSSATLKTVLVDLLNYGAAAQDYFDDYGINDLANADLTAEQEAYATKTVTPVDNRVKGTNYAGSSISLKSNILLTMYFQNLTSELLADPSVDDLYAVVTYADHYGNEEELRVEGENFYASGDMHGVDITGLAVADGKQLVTCVIYDADGNEIARAVDSIESYIARMANNADPIYEMVMKFITSAIAHFG